MFASAKRGRDARVKTKKLKEKGIILPAETGDAMPEEIPEPIRMVDEVADVVHNAGLARKSCARPVKWELSRLSAPRLQRSCRLFIIRLNVACSAAKSSSGATNSR